jgi:hypothetical protein
MDFEFLDKSTLEYQAFCNPRKIIAAKLRFADSLIWKSLIQDVAMSRFI